MGRAVALEASGRWFKSNLPDQNMQVAGVVATYLTLNQVS